jgi:PAS domain S-box-containing protein
VKNNHNNEATQRAVIVEDQLRLVIDTIPGFVWSASPDGAIEFLNQRGLDYTGFSLQQIKGWNWKDTNILHPDDIQSLFETWSAIVTSGEPGEIQARIRRFDGEYRWFLFRVAPLRDESGRLVAWWGIDVEIDARKNAEDLLAGEKRLLEMMARGDPLVSVLAALCRIVEEIAGGSLCSILLVDSNGAKLRHAAAPSLPRSYMQWIDGRAIALEEGPCASAAHKMETQIALFQSYPWPGNIRELQNVIERSVILAEMETFSVDESWLSPAPVPTLPARRPRAEEFVTQEKEMIEAALAASKGKVSGPTGAAARLGMPPSTLDSKIKALKINEHRFKTNTF